MTINFKCKETKKIFDGIISKKFPPEISKIGKRKLDIIHAAFKEQDLFTPPANRLEKLKGDLNGFCSIRINDEYKLVFKFKNGNAQAVYITDYHK